MDTLYASVPLTVTDEILEFGHFQIFVQLSSVLPGLWISCTTTRKSTNLRNMSINDVNDYFQIAEEDELQELWPPPPDPHAHPQGLLLPRLHPRRHWARLHILHRLHAVQRQSHRPQVTRFCEFCCTMWPVRLITYFCWHQNESCILVKGVHTVMKLWFWHQQKLVINLIGHLSCTYREDPFGILHSIFVVMYISPLYFQQFCKYLRLQYCTLNISEAI